MNKKLINSLKTIASKHREDAVQEAADTFTPDMYAAMALALHSTFGFSKKRISRVFAESQRIWCTQFAGREEELLDECKRVTGVELQRVNRDV